MFDRFIINSNDFDGPVLVTGAGGCIGSWVVALLLKANISVVAFDISKNKMEIHQHSAEPWKVTLIDTGLNTQTGGRLNTAD